MNELILTHYKAKYKIVKDPYCYALQKYKINKQTNEGYWESIGYHKELKYVFQRLISYNVLDDAEQKTMYEVFDHIYDVCDKLEAEVNNVLGGLK